MKISTRYLYSVVSVQELCMYTESASYSYIGGGRLRNLNLIKSREKKKLTQEQLAKILDYKGKQSVAAHSVQRWRINPPTGSAQGVLFWIKGDEAKEVSIEVDMTTTKAISDTGCGVFGC